MNAGLSYFFQHGIWDMFRIYNFFAGVSTLVAVLIDSRRWWQMDRRRRLLGVAVTMFAIAMIEGTVESRLMAASTGPRNALFAAAITFCFIASADGIRYGRYIKKKK